MEVLGMGRETSPRQSEFSFGRLGPASLASSPHPPLEPHLKKVTEYGMVPVEHSSFEDCLDAIKGIVEGSQSPTRTLLHVSYKNLGGNASERGYTFSLDARFFHHNRRGGRLHYFQHQTCLNTGVRTYGVGDEIDTHVETEGFLEEVIEKLRDRNLFSEEGSVFALSAESEQVRKSLPYHYLVHSLNPKS